MAKKDNSFKLLMTLSITDLGAYEFLIVANIFYADAEVTGL